VLPSFETSRLLLRPRSMADFAACLAMDREAEVTKYVQGPWDDPDEHKRFLIDRIERDWGPGLGYWSIFSKQGPGAFIGWILLIPYEAVGPDIDIGWRLRRGAWGSGYAAEAARPIVKHAFDKVGLPRIVADIDPRNVGSIRVAEKIGMRFAGDGKYANGEACKAYVMTKDDFAAAYRRNPARLGP
jgi:RimJ/RimL family protein N-acetyltransferase